MDVLDTDHHEKSKVIGGLSATKGDDCAAAYPARRIPFLTQCYITFTLSLSTFYTFVTIIVATDHGCDYSSPSRLNFNNEEPVGDYDALFSRLGSMAKVRLEMFDLIYES
ncbi:unnamed protein product [Angiostrongylus costaricensis]|uniref:Sulfatase domain-containing protein n=1 Tax=Angiostrongylus costaricensis TaxID=334426 RepID=A0A0R3PUK0_ANGCS|nr:unnamed protein product [Angiostrongylus costaricensis]